ncbi:MAG TPA: hypothetical protein VMB21_15755 [Candidatus Limnocylindria bacterium]|jgi:hypothetical protein|nr:hypothetical protein [Candidatus Limnocylindria bacterium]
MNTIPSHLRISTLLAGAACLAGLARADDPVGAEVSVNIVHGSIYASPGPDINHVQDIQSGTSSATGSVSLLGVGRVVDTGFGSPSTVTTMVSGQASATADYAAGILRTGASLQFSASNGYGTAGSTALATMGDILTLSAPATITLSGIWEGTLTGDGNPLGSVTSTLDLSLRSLTYDKSVSDGEGGFHTVPTSDVFGSYHNQLFAPIVKGALPPGGVQTKVSEPFSITVSLPAGEFYFGASMSSAVLADADRTPSAYYVTGNADFSHTLEFGFAVPEGVSLTSQTGEDVPPTPTAVPEPQTYALFGGIALLAWGVWRRR